MNRPYTDRETLMLLLKEADLLPHQRHSFQGFLHLLDTGIGKLPKNVRDNGMAILRVQGLLPAQPHKQKRTGVWEEDTFSAVRTKGTEEAETLLAKPLPMKPPGKVA